MPELFSVTRALQLGRFVSSAYDLFSAGDPPSPVLPDGYSLVSKVYAADITDGLPVYKVFGLIARLGGDVIIAIRGTEGVMEWIRDAFFLPARFPYVDAGLTEQGFTGFYSTFRVGPANISERVTEALRDIVADGTVQTMAICGHSLGSALATMLAIDVAGNQVFSPTAYTFASPRVGDKVFAGTYDALVPVSWRIANLHDIVPRVPSQFAGYVHTDAEVPINSDDRTRQNYRCWHSLATYMNTLDGRVGLDAACAVP
jgi:predicted lipase